MSKSKIVKVKWVKPLGKKKIDEISEMPLGTALGLKTNGYISLSKSAKEYLETLEASGINVDSEEVKKEAGTISTQSSKQV